MPYQGEINRCDRIRNTTKRSLAIWASCENCGKERWVELRHGKPRATLCQKCSIQSKDRRDKISKSLRCENSPKWKGGFYKHGDGYKMIYVYPDSFFAPMSNHGRYVLEHRLVMALYLGRCLQPFERVHHKNGVKDDNRIENLELIGSQGEHIQSHSKGYRDGYQQGLKDGRTKQIQELRQEIRLLRWELRGVKNDIK